MTILRNGMLGLRLRLHQALGLHQAGKSSKEKEADFPLTIHTVNDQEMTIDNFSTKIQAESRNYEPKGLQAISLETLPIRVS